MRKDVLFPLRISDDEVSLVEAIEAKTHAGSKAEVWRQALYSYARTLKIKLPVKKS